MGDIFRAIQEGDVGQVARQLDADPTLLETADPKGHRPLTAAARHGQLGVVALLLQRSADIEAKGRFGKTALEWATRTEHEDVVALLLSKGAQADPNALFAPIMSGCLGCARLLVRHMAGEGLNVCNSAVETALILAASWGYPEMVRLLLLAGADPTLTDCDGLTARWHAENEVEGLCDSEAEQARARCVEVFDWWNGELERRYLLTRATCLHKAHTTQLDMPTSQVPTYLEARVAAGHAVPGVEVVSPQPEAKEEEQEGEEANDKKEAAVERGNEQGTEAGEEERHAMLMYVVEALNEELVIELLEGLPIVIEDDDEEEEEEEEEEEAGEEKEEEG